VDDLPIDAAEKLDLDAVRIEIRVGFADQVLHRRAIGVGKRPVGQSKAPVAILRENKVRDGVDHLSEERPLLLERRLRSLALGNVEDYAHAAPALDFIG